MYEIFDELIKARGLTAYRVSQATGVSQATLSDWKHGRSTPKVDKLQRIADFLGVPLSQLMGQPPAERPSNLLEAGPTVGGYVPTEEEIKRFLFGDTEVTDELYERLKSYARFLKDQTDRELAERDKNSQR